MDGTIDKGGAVELRLDGATIEGYLAQQAPGMDPDELRQLGVDVIRECRNTLMLRFRYLDSALWRMPLATDRGGAEVYCLMTDGRRLVFGPMAAAVRFRPLTPQAASAYLDLAGTTDRAGAYDVADHGAEVVESLTGSRTCVMGLPAEVVSAWCAAHLPAAPSA